MECDAPSFSESILSALKILLMVLSAVMIAIGLIVGGSPTHFYVFFAAIFSYALASIIFRWGWVVPCTLFGVLLGPSLGPSVRGGTLESQTWEDIQSIGKGFILGFLVGIVLDAGAPLIKRDDNTKPQAPNMPEPPPPPRTDHA